MFLDEGTREGDKNRRIDLKTATISNSGDMKPAFASEEEFLHCLESNLKPT